MEARMSIDADEATLPRSASESDLFLPEKHASSSLRRPWPLWPWILSTCFLGVLAVVLIVLLFEHEHLHPWRASDLPDSRRYIEHEQVMFTGNSKYDENGRFFVPEPSIYVQDPGPEVDDAWESLCGERDFKITEEEATGLWGENADQFWHHQKQGYVVGLDLFHTLHCLNNLRKFYFPDYYPIAEKHRDSAAQHRGHCIDQIRQYVMCAGDMTPYGTKWYDNPGRQYADSDVFHTCRNFGKLREYVRDRYHAGGELHIPEVAVWDKYKSLE